MPFLSSTKWKTFYQWIVSEHYILDLSILISPMAFLLVEIPALLASIELLFCKNEQKEPYTDLILNPCLNLLASWMLETYMKLYLCITTSANMYHPHLITYSIILMNQVSYQTRQYNLLFIEKWKSVFTRKQPYFRFHVM